MSKTSRLIKIKMYFLFKNYKFKRNVLFLFIQIFKLKHFLSLFQFHQFFIGFTILQKFSVRLGTKMSIVTKWLLWSRKLYLLFPLKSLLFLQLILFYPLFLHNGGATQSKECHFIFSGRYLHRNILLIPYRRELSFVFEFECGFRS